MSDFKIGKELSGLAQAELARANAQAERASNLTKLGAAKTGAAHEKEIEKAGTQFEAMLVHEMIKSMWSTVPKDGMLSGSSEEALYQDMLHEQIANSIAENQSIGVKDVIISDIKKAEARK